MTSKCNSTRPGSDALMPVSELEVYPKPGPSLHRTGTERKDVGVSTNQGR